METGCHISLLAQSPGGIGGAAQELSKTADKKFQPIIIVVGILIVVVIAVILFKLKRD